VLFCVGNFQSCTIFRRKSATPHNI
jgi:hypothetical protein